MNKKILLIDDVQEDLDLLAYFLKKAGYENIIVAKNGEDGVQLAKDESPDIVISDTSMPGIDGFETCQQIKSIEGLDVILIVLTGKIDTVDAEKAKKVGADFYTVKTVNFEHLLQILAKLEEDDT